jgi:hypothetical protein
MFLLLAGCDSPNVSRTLGAQCDSRTECKERCERGPEYPDGICTVACENDGDCPSSARCVDKEGGICLFACDADPDCEFLGAGWSCDGKDQFEDTQVEVLVCFGE